MQLVHFLSCPGYNSGRLAGNSCDSFGAVSVARVSVCPVSEQGQRKLHYDVGKNLTAPVV